MQAPAELTREGGDAARGGAGGQDSGYAGMVGSLGSWAVSSISKQVPLDCWLFVDLNARPPTLPASDAGVDQSARGRDRDAGQ